MKEFFVIAAVLLASFTPFAYPNELKYDIGVNLSDVCLSAIAADLPTPCPDYLQIATVFPDTTNQKISGSFEFVDGIYQRNDDKLNSHYEFYRTDNKKVRWLDPPADTMSRIKVIEIRPSLPYYKIGNSTIMILNETTDTFSYFLGHSRYVSDNCMYAAITSENWIFNLADTIRYMDNDCDPEFTKMNTVEKLTKEKTVFDIRETRDYIHKQWIQKINSECLKVFQKCNDDYLN